MPVNSERERLVAAIREQAPRAPGVYIYFDRAGHTLYIGKSVRLRERMLSYFSPCQSRLEARIQQMVCNIASFAMRPTETELLALLLEDALIKRSLPPYNTRQREHGKYCYLELTGDAYPCLRTVDADGPVTGALFGPFRDRYATADIIRFLGRACGMRTCTDAQPRRNCANHGLGLCLGPCQGACAEEEYALAVRRAADTLSGDASFVREMLEAEVTRLAEGLEFERAAEAQAQLRHWSGFCAQQRFVQRFRAGEIEVREPDRVYRFDAAGRVDVRSDGKACLIPPELREPLSDPRWVLDRADVVYTWLQRRDSAPDAA